MSGDLKTGLPVPRIGDEVLIRGRVKRYISGVGCLVEVFSKTEQYQRWVREDLIEKVIPADQTRTFKGYTVAQTRMAIQQFDALIDDIRAAPAEPSPATELSLASLEGAREDLVHQLEAIGVPVEEQS